MIKSRLNIKSKLTLGTDQLWILVILAGFLFYVSLIPLPPNDFWWHLKIGEIIFTDKYIPSINMFAWSIPNTTPFFYAAWLGEFLFYVLHKLGGLEIIIFIRTFLAAIAFGLVGYLARVKSDSWRVAAITTTLACVMSMNNLPVRTQMWSWIPFVLILIILNYYTEKSQKLKSLIAIPFIMIFWINVHGTFILGYVLLGMYCIGIFVERILSTNRRLEWTNFFHLVLISSISVIALFINPRSIEIVQYVSNVITNPPIQSFIEEWLPPSPHGIANTTFFISILGILVIFVYSTYKPTITELLLIVSFSWLAFNGQRSVIWYAFVSMPILARSIAALPVKNFHFDTQKKVINNFLGLIVFIPLILIQPWFVQNFPLPNTYLDQVIIDSKDGPLLSIDTPIEAVEYLKKHPGGNLFNEMGYGSYLIWKFPDQQIFIDPRIELFPIEIWEDYINMSRGVNVEELVKHYDIRRIMLDKSLQKGLSNTLAKNHDWVLEFEYMNSQIWNNKNK